MSNNIKNIWKISTNIFSFLLLSSSLWFSILLLKEKNFELFILVFFLIPIILSIGIFFKMELARRVCLWYLWIFGLWMIFASLCFEYNPGILWKNIIMVLTFLTLVTLFLVHPKVRELFT